MSTPRKPTFKESFKSFLFWFCIFYLIFSVVAMWTQEPPDKGEQQEVEVSLQDSTLKIGHLAHFTLHNTSNQALAFRSPCSPEGDSASLQIRGVVRGEKTENNLLSDVDLCTQNAPEDFVLAPGATKDIDLRQVSSAVFTEEGQYLLQMRFYAEGQEDPIDITSPTFSYDTPGIFRKLFRALVSKPLFNLLVFFTKWSPGHSFGWAIILLTLVVRLVLLVPNQKAMKSQYQMQKIQPKITEIRQKYKGNPQMMATKTMELYRTHQINPMGSLLPILIQFPVLIGTYFIIVDGISPHLNYLLYGFNGQLSLADINQSFGWLQLDQVDGFYVLPVLVGVVQFASMKISFARNKKKSDAKGASSDMAASMQKTMLYFLPVMIGGFTAVFPSGIGLYWLVSTLFGAIQQYWVNRSMEGEGVVRRVE